MDSYRRDILVFHVIGDHNQLTIMTPYGNDTARLCISVPFA